MKEKEHELKSLLTGQKFDITAQHARMLKTAHAYASGFSHTTEGIVVISDFLENECYIHSGRFGQTLIGLPEFSTGYNTAFEDEIFHNADKEDIWERHILELRCFNFLKDIPVEHRTDYQLSCLIRFYKGGDRQPATILHTSRYIECDESGNVILGLCTYTPSPQPKGKWNGDIMNIVTGEIVDQDLYGKSDRRLLSRRQLEILSLLAKGISSKQIADQLNISQFTVNRHRQDILSCLKVSNTAAAVEIGLRMNLI